MPKYYNIIEKDEYVPNNHLEERDYLNLQIENLFLQQENLHLLSSTAPINIFWERHTYQDYEKLEKQNKQFKEFLKYESSNKKIITDKAI